MRHMEKVEVVSRSQLLLQYLLATGTTPGNHGPSAAVIRFDTPAPSSILQVASAGILPEDGFAA
jgi:hypothetical protein